MSVTRFSMFTALRAAVALGLTLIGTIAAQAEQYAPGMQQVISSQGQLVINTGHVSHFNANDFYVYSFLFQPKDSKEWHQVPRIEKENDPKMLFTIQTKHTPDAVLFDAKIVSAKQRLYLLTASKEVKKTLADEGPVAINIYELVKLDDYERWVFLRKTIQKTAPKVSVEKALENASKQLAN